MTLLYIKEFGEYVGFSDDHKAYMYRMNDKFYIWNGKGIEQVSVF